MFCSKCGKQIPDGSAFCPMCGQSLSGVSSSARSVPAGKGTADKLKSLTQRYNTAYLFQDADRFLSIASDALPDEESTLEAMAKSVGGRTGGVIREKLNSGEKRFDYRALLTPLIMQDAGVSSAFAGEIAGYFGEMLGWQNAAPSSAPVSTPVSQPVYSAQSSTPARPVAPVSTPAPKPAYTAPKKKGEEIRVSADTLVRVPEGEIGSAMPEGVPVPKESEAATWGDVPKFIGLAAGLFLLMWLLNKTNLFNIGIYIYLPLSLLLALASPFMAMAATRLDASKSRTRDGETCITCAFKPKNGKTYAIAVDGVWIRDRISSGFSFVIEGQGEHHVALTVDRTGCADFKKITL